MVVIMELRLFMLIILMPLPSRGLYDRHGFNGLSTCRRENWQELIDQRYWRQSTYLICTNVLSTSPDSNLSFYPADNSISNIGFYDSIINILPVKTFSIFPSLHTLFLNNSAVNVIYPGAFSGLMELRELFLQNNNITTLSIGMFNTLENLKILNLSCNNIEEIEDKTFLGLSSIETLLLRDNKLKSIESDLLQNLHNLFEIDLSCNNIEEIEDKTFLGSYSIESLLLRDNKLKSIESDLLQNLHNLFEIDLSCNNIEEIEDKTFLGSYSIESLLLRDNKLKSIESELLQNLHNLSEIDLSNNMLSTFPSNLLEDTPQLKKLNLCYNYLSEFMLKTLPYKISYLSLHHNYINNVVDIRWLAYLEHFDISYNNISRIQAIPRQLISLNISNNNLKTLNNSIFNHASMLETLEISNNSISYLEENTFINTSHLRYLSLANNNLTTISIGIFCNLSNLEVLNISGNQIKELQYGTFTGLKKLYNLDMSNNDLEYLHANLFYGIPMLRQINIEKNHITTIDTRDLIAYFRHLNTVLLNKNPWDCRILASVITEFVKRNITVLNGFDIKSENVHGIACFRSQNGNISLFSKNKSISFSTNALKITDSTLKNISSNNNENSRELENSRFYTYFNNILPDKIDSFLSKIQNYFESKFKNVSFYKSSDDLNKKILNKTLLPSIYISHFERFVSDNEFKSKELLNKISNISNNIVTNKTGTVVFMLIIIILLVVIVSLLTFTIMKTRFKRLFNRRADTSNSSVELM